MNFFTRIKSAIFGAPSVEKALASFKAALAKLEDTISHHNLIAEAKAEEAKIAAEASALAAKVVAEAQAIRTKIANLISGN